MAAHGRSSLRDLFDESPTPHIAHPPHTHHRDYYLATDGSYRRSGGGIGAVIETRDGRRVHRIARQDGSPNNNVAEYKALDRGLEALADRTPADARIGVLVDHDDLASAVNSAVIAASRTAADTAVPIGSEGTLHWRRIQRHIGRFHEVRVARIDSDQNPAHPLANAPHEYGHLERSADRCLRPDPAVTAADAVPPPSRADRSPVSD